MPLTCWCGDGEDTVWNYYPPNDYRPFPSTLRRKRCTCGTLINHGELCACFPRSRRPRTEIEVKIYGEDGDIHISTLWFCERCSDLYFSFVELGYSCIAPDENMLELVEEYADDH